MKSSLLAFVIALSATSLIAQTTSASAPMGTAMSPNMKSNAVRSGRMRAGAPESRSVVQLESAQVKELEDTLAKMQTLVKAMKIKAAESKNKAAQANVQLWELLVSHLDQTLTREKRVAAEHADLIARRESLYKQAQMNADMAAARARAAAAMASPSNNAAPAPMTQLQQPPTETNKPVAPKD